MSHSEVAQLAEQTTVNR